VDRGPIAASRSRSVRHPPAHSATATIGPAAGRVAVRRTMGRIMDPIRREELIAAYRAGPDVVQEALAEATEAELDARPEPDGWTAREVVHHLADSEMISAIRLRRLIAEDDPEIVGYDEMELSRRLFYDDRPIRGSLEAFRGASISTADILDRLTEDQWGRSGTHTERGPYGVEDWLEIHATHAQDHAEQIRRARASASGG
jgi:DinB superfamily